MMRPSSKYPTLELRAPDCCTRLDDAIAIASLHRALVRHFYYNPALNSELDAVGRALAVENKWRAQRYGVQGTFVTEAGAVRVANYLDGILEMTQPDAEALECAELGACRRIIARGTSADEQIAIFKRTGGDLNAVVEWLESETRA